MGAGLAGCLLGWRFKQAGLPFQIIGSSALPSAWSVAAGIINPVTGRWMTKSWLIDTLLAEAKSLYQSIEEQLSIRVYHPLPVRRYCQNSEDVKRCKRRTRNPRYSNVLSAYDEPGAGPDSIRDTHGSFEILKAGYVDLPVLIKALHKLFTDHQCFTDHVFDYNKLKPVGSAWTDGHTCYDRVIFCEGAGITENPWFNGLPIRPAKGETLILRSQTLQLPPTIYHSTKWLLPYHPSSFRIGATYDESDSSPEPTSEGKVALLAAAAKILSKQQDFEVEAHLAGIRPSTSDSRPFLGEHPEQAGLYVLNGLGSKGTSVAPEMSRQIFQQIFANDIIDPEVDIARFPEFTK